MAKLIVGLGNPGARYANTRHNVGWHVLDAFARKHGVAIEKNGHHGLYGELNWGAAREKIVLLRPVTYMNLSGRAVASAVRFYKLEPKDVLVVYDDLDLVPGRLRIREKGSAGGHNGMKSVIGDLGTEEFPRLRIGIGRPAPHWDVVDWVLAPFGPDDAASIAQVSPRAVEAVEAFLTEGVLKAMTQFNS
jgi:PTH1 family peptidyl-tRNA hydrolase